MQLVFCNLVDRESTVCISAEAELKPQVSEVLERLETLIFAPSGHRPRGSTNDYQVSPWSF